MAKHSIWNIGAISFLIVHMCICFVSANDVIDMGGYQIHLTPISGMLNITRPDGMKIGISFLELTESDMFGTPIMMPDHSLTEGDFNSLNFSGSDACHRTVLHSNSVDSRYFYYNTTLSTLPSKAPFIAEVYFVTSEGFVSNNNELTNVQPNDVKMTFTFSGWDFCKPCAAGDGQSLHGKNLDLKFALDLPTGRKLEQTVNKTTLPKLYGIGNRMELSLSRKVYVDGTWKTMEAPFPKIVETNGRYEVQIRIPEFSETAMYDPVFSLDTDDLEPKNNPENESSVVCSGPGRPPIYTGGVTGLFPGSQTISMTIAALTMFVFFF